MRTRPLCFVCLFIILLQGGLLIMKGRDSRCEIPASSIFYEKSEEPIVIKGQVYKKEITSNNQILYLKNNSTNDSKILIYDSTFSKISIGNYITAKGKLYTFETARNTGNFDRALYYARQNIYGYMRCDEIVRVSGDANKLLEGLHQLKTRWKNVLIDSMGEKNGGIMSAILLGEKREMDSEMKELYQNNGISHILAVSGLHISFIGLGIYHLFRKTGIGFAFSGVLSLIMLTLYILIIGFSVSAIRAYVMLLIRIGADITGRVYDMLTAAMLGAAITIAYQPLYLTDAGFYMSYGAIIAIIIILPLFPKGIFSKCYASITINIILFPLTLWFYFVFPTYSFLLNLIVIPCMSPVLGVGMIGSGLCLFWKDAGMLSFKICGRFLEMFEKICKVGNKLPYARLVLGKPEIYEIVLYYLVLIIIVCFLKYKKNKMSLWIILFAVSIAICYKPKGNLSITMLDVGQGDGIYINGPQGKNYLIDGGSSDIGEVGKYRIEPFLESQGVGVLDYVFITHGDADHYSGIVNLLERQDLGVRIKSLILPANYNLDDELVKLSKKAKEENVEVLCIEPGQVIEEGGMSIRCIQPSKNDTILFGNAGSMVLEIIYGNFSMLCTGDVEGDGENLLVSNVCEQYDVLKVSHHGSKYSTKDELLDIIKPEIALISAGVENRYGHPHEELIRRLELNGCEIYSTQKNGAIMLQTDGNSLTIW